MKLAFALSTLVLASACLTGGGGDGDDFDSKKFVGAYRSTITLSGGGSQTLTDSLSITEGTTSDLIFTSQQMGSIKGTVIGATGFSLDQQQITLTDASGAAFSVTLQGQGTVSDGVFNANGTLSSSTGALSFTMAGSRL